MEFLRRSAAVEPSEGCEQRGQLRLGEVSPRSRVDQIQSERGRDWVGIGNRLCEPQDRSRGPQSRYLIERIEFLVHMRSVGLCFPRPM